MADHYYSETNTFNLTDEEWEDFHKDHPRARKVCEVFHFFSLTYALNYMRALLLVDPSTHATPISEPLESEDTHSSSEDETQNPDTLESPNVQPPETQHIRENGQERDAQTPSAQCSESMTFVPLVDQERPSALNAISNGERTNRRGKALTKER